MVRYALLIAPSANRVYADASIRLTAAELAVFAATVLDAKIADDRADRRSAACPTSASPRPTRLTERDIDLPVQPVVGLRAVRSVEGDLLRPIAMRPLAFFDDDLLTIQKYSRQDQRAVHQAAAQRHAARLGRTAPQMLDRRLVVLDPLCGRGTTLNQALMYGYDAIGIDTDGKDFDIYSAFIRTWLKRKRIKHKAEITPVRKDKRILARRLSVSIGTDTSLTVFHADTHRGPRVPQGRRRRRDRRRPAVRRDARQPYRRATNLSRSPLQLLRVGGSGVVAADPAGWRDRHVVEHARRVARRGGRDPGGGRAAGAATAPATTTSSTGSTSRSTATSWSPASISRRESSTAVRHMSASTGATAGRTVTGSWLSTGGPSRSSTPSCPRTGGATRGSAALIEAAISHGAKDWNWLRTRWGIVFEVAFDDSGTSGRSSASCRSCGPRSTRRPTRSTAS